MSEPNTTERAQELEKELDEARAAARDEVAKEATDEEQQRILNDRVASLEAQVAAARQAAPVEPPAVEPPAPPADPYAERFSSIEKRLDDIAQAVTKPVEPIKDAVAAVTETAGAAVEDATEVVESVPTRTHGLFKKVFGGGHD